MTTQVSIHEAKTHLSRLIQRALAGEDIVIARGKEPLVRLTIVPEAQPQRRIGGAASAVVHIDEDFDAPLPDFAEYMP
jgi:antitoxin (DNA-binding transcriptional repressor) of toxin-antitoxin stability system